MVEVLPARHGAAGRRGRRASRRSSPPGRRPERGEAPARARDRGALPRRGRGRGGRGGLRPRLQAARGARGRPRGASSSRADPVAPSRRCCRTAGLASSTSERAGASSTRGACGSTANRCDPGAYDVPWDARSRARVVQVGKRRFARFVGRAETVLSDRWQVHDPPRGTGYGTFIAFSFGFAALRGRTLNAHGLATVFCPVPLLRVSPLELEQPL